MTNVIHWDLIGWWMLVCGIVVMIMKASITVIIVHILRVRYVIWYTTIQKSEVSGIFFS